MFSAPLSAYHAGAALEAFRKIQAHPEMVAKLHENVDYFRAKLASIPWKADMNPLMKMEVYGVPGQPISPIVFRDDPTRVFKICTKLKENGFLTGAVVAPACPLRTPRLRVTSHAGMTKDSMDRFISVLQELCETVPMSRLL
jgi:7-keto-8-aminopelargonate synthetase-like enzyme